MKIVYTDSFFKSLKVMIRHQTWWYKTYELFRYKIPAFFRNVWFFRKELWEFRGWDYSFNLQLFSRSLKKTSSVLRDGHEEEISRNKKVEKINRVIDLLNNVKTDYYVSRAELELGELQNLDNWLTGREDSPEEYEHNKKVYERARQIEESEWSEIWDILKGQNSDEYKSKLNDESLPDKEKRGLYDKWFDGSGMRGWWD